MEEVDEVEEEVGEEVVEEVEEAWETVQAKVPVRAECVAKALSSCGTGGATRRMACNVSSVASAIFFSLT